MSAWDWFIVGFIIFGFLIFGLVIYEETGREYKIVEGNVIDYRIDWISNNLGGERPILVLTFDNGETYKLNIWNDDRYDFTKQSTLVLEITRTRSNDTWDIVKFIKVPEVR
jgi:hypothetical protein